MIEGGQGGKSEVLGKIFHVREPEMEIAANIVRPGPPRPLLRVKDLGWLVYLYPGRWLARFLPPSWMYAVGDALAWFASFALRAPRRRLMERLALAFPAEAGSSRLEQIARNYFRNAVRRFQDDLVMERHAPASRPSTAELVNLENLTAALSSGRGALLISGHFFASRAAKRYLHSVGYPALSVRNHEPPDDWAGRFGKRFVQMRYVKFLAGVLGEEVDVHDPDSSLKMLARLRWNGLIDLHMDASFSRELVPLDFLGKPRPFPTGFLHLAWIARAPLVPMLCLGDSRRLRIEFGTPVHPCEWQNRARFVEDGLARMVKTLEEQVLRAPEQWDAWIRW